MPREKITRRQKNLSRLLREKKKIRKDKLKAFKKGIFFILAMVLASLTVSCGNEAGGMHRITRVIDGDTVELENRERVRLIGIDTPEAWYCSKLERDARRTKKDHRTIIEMGKRATKFTRSLAEGKEITLEFDAEKRDRYGRLLAYVYLPDGKMLNAELLREGYAQVYTFPPNVKYVGMFLELQKESRDSGRGLWKEWTL